MSNDEIMSLKQHIKDCDHDIEVANKLAELRKNPLFNELIMEMFCSNGIVYSLQASLCYRLPETARKTAEDRAKAGAVLLSWFDELERVGETATNSKHEALDRINEIIANPSDNED